MLHSVAEAGRGGENARRSRKSIVISSLACSEMWVKMSHLDEALAVAIEVQTNLVTPGIATDGVSSSPHAY